MKKIFLVLTLLVSGFGFAESWVLHCHYVEEGFEQKEKEEGSCFGYCDNKLYIDKDKKTARINMRSPFKIVYWSDTGLIFNESISSYQTARFFLDLKSLRMSQDEFYCPEEKLIKEIESGIGEVNIDKRCSKNTNSAYSDQFCRIIEYEK
tara:strand:- start:27 stop:476 length:450 start_codon:yes stop_codon:yes gene_type:complete